MELSQLRYFVAVAKEGNFSRAAKVLEIAQPSLSDQIKRLEKSLGQLLFDRLPRGVVLTESGRMLLARAQRLLDDAETARREMSESGGRVAGVLRIGAIPTIAPYLLPRVVAPFLKKHPEVRLQVSEDVTSRLLPAVESGLLDCVILSSAIVPATVSLEQIGEETLMAIMPVKHPLTKRAKIRPADLRAEKMLVLKEMHCLSGQVAEFCPVNLGGVTVEGEQLSTLVMMVELGLGISVIPAMAARSLGRAGLVTRPLAGRVVRPICVAMSVLRYRSNAVRAFLEMLRPVCGVVCGRS